ncbi:MAG: ABC transporter permease [Caldilineaceae bacterium]
MPVTLEATVETLLNSVDLSALDLSALATALDELRTAADSGDLGVVDTSVFSGTGTLTDTFGILGAPLYTEALIHSLAQQPSIRCKRAIVLRASLWWPVQPKPSFFALFTGVFGILSVYEERKQWTLQRMLASPTGGNTILLGKLLGNLIVVMAQLLILIVIALTVVASVALGEPTSIWGTQVGLLLVVVVSLSLAVSGVGVLIVGLARTPEQVQIIGPIVNMMLGVFGGAFGFPLPEPLPKLSLISWGTGAFEKLAGGQLDIGLNLVVLLAQGVLFFVVGSWFFRRRLNL